MTEFGEQDTTNAFLNTYKSMLKIYLRNQSPRVAEKSAIGKTVISTPKKEFSSLSQQQIEHLTDELNKLSPEGMRNWADDAKRFPYNTDPRNIAVLNAYTKLQDSSED